MATTSYNKQTIGPRVVGGRYLCGYWGQEYTVTEICEGADSRISWTDLSITCKWADGRVTTHCTSWDAKWDRVVSQPTATSSCERCGKHFEGAECDYCASL